MADFTLAQLLIVASAREIVDGDFIFAGVGKPTLGALLAKKTHAPNSIIATESGFIGPEPKRIMLGIGDNAGGENCICATALWRLFSDQQRGYVDIGMVGGAQVDRYGNLNSTLLFGDGDYYQPAVRLPGSGGANDIASCAKRTLISIPFDRKKFLVKCDYVTSPGYLTGGNSRAEAGLEWGGPSAIITDKCIFRFHPVTKEIVLTQVHPGVTVEEIKSEIPSWDLMVADEVTTTTPPSEEEIKVINLLDPEGIYTGNGLSTLTFESYIQMLKNSYELFN